MATKQMAPLSEADLRWLEAERALIARELLILAERINELQKRTETVSAQATVHESRLTVLERPSATPKAASSQASLLAEWWQLVRGTASLHLWKITIGLGALGAYRVLTGQWPQQEQWLGLLRQIF